MRSYWVYILASKPRGTLYIGVTNGIIFRIEQHRAGKGSTFTRKYKVHQSGLVPGICQCARRNPA